MQRKIARDFENDIADKEDAGGKTELGCCERKIGGHPVRTSKGNCGTIQEVDEEHQRDERNQPDRNFRYRRLFNCRHFVRFLLHCSSSLLAY